MGRLCSLACAWLLVACAAARGPAPSRAPAASARASEAAAPSPAPAPAAPPAPAPPAPRRMTLELPELDELISKAIAAHKLPGCTIAIGRGDGVVFQRAYGARALVPKYDAMTEDTIFDLASLSKAVATTTIAMHLVERGTISLDTKVSELLPEVVPRARNITVRMLLLHTSGLPAVNPRNDLEGSPQEVLAKLLRVAPKTPPGARYEYSDIGFIWLGELLARAAHEPLDALVAGVLTQPLALTQTGYRPATELRPRIAPTEVTPYRAVGLIHGEVHDPRAYRLGGVAGNAGVFSTAADLSRFARMMLGGGELDGVRVIGESTLAQFTAAQDAAGVRRTLGWDVKSPHARIRGKLLSPRAYGHGGFTGTALWIDPDQDLFVVFLSNRVHPDGKGDVLDLIAEVSDAAVRGVVRAEPCPLEREPVRAGIDVLREHAFAELMAPKPRKVGLLTHRAARTRDGATTLDVLAGAVDLRALFTPEHGLDAQDEGVIANAKLGAVPVYSLFGKTRRPTPAMLKGLDVLVIDLVDVGTRFYTYASTVREALIAASEAKLPVLLLDRPNPIGADRVEGPMLDPGQRSFVNHHPLPVRHGLTLGELAQLMVNDLGLKVALRIVPVAGYERSMQQPDTGLAWYPPSPNLRSETAALLYPAVGILESTPISVGRGTDTPFELVGAPFIHGARLAEELTMKGTQGVAFSAVSFTPSAAPYAGVACEGVRIRITDRREYRSERTAFALIRTLLQLYGEQWDHSQLIRLLGHRRTLRALEQDAPYMRLLGLSVDELRAFYARRGGVLRYPVCSAPR